MSHPAPAAFPLPSLRSAVPTALAAALVALAATPAHASTVFDVASRSELSAAMSKAKAGDTIRLAPGNYGSINWDRIRYTDGQVTIRSADPANRATFGQMLFGAATGIALAGVDIQSNLSPVVAISGRDVTFAGNRVRGLNLNNDPWDDNNSGLHVRGARRVIVASNEFQDLRAGLYVQRTEDVTVRHNSFIHLREGVNIATVTRATFDNNLFHSFSPAYRKGEHPDAMQFWNSYETSGSSDVKIRNNFFSLGTKGAIHGIFVGTEQQNLPYSNFEISGNIYYGSALHGISLGVVNDSKLTNNVVLASPWADLNNSSYKSPDGREGGAMQPHIRLGMGARVTASHNIATVFSATSTSLSRVVTDSIDVYDTGSRKGVPLDTVFMARPTADLPRVSEFVTRPDSEAAARGIGILRPFPVGALSVDPTVALRVAAGIDAGGGLLPPPTAINQPAKL